MDAAESTFPEQLIAHILERFHEPHRRDLPGLVRIAKGLGTDAPATELAARLAKLQPALELHMFMEEMRLFPMMCQGGHVLVGALIEDMGAEHAVHARELGVLRTLVERACSAPGREQAGARIGRFLDALEAHIAIEEDVLFPMFVPATGVAASGEPARTR